MDDLFLQNALSRSLGIEIGESVGFVSVTSRGSTGSGTLREDVHHLFVEIEALPKHWVDNLRFELSKFQFQELKLLEFENELDAKNAYSQFCRNLNPEHFSIGASTIKFECVAIQVDDSHKAIIILRDRKKLAE